MTYSILHKIWNHFRQCQWSSALYVLYNSSTNHQEHLHEHLYWWYSHPCCTHRPSKCYHHVTSTFRPTSSLENQNPWILALEKISALQHSWILQKYLRLGVQYTYSEEVHSTKAQTDIFENKIFILVNRKKI